MARLFKNKYRIDSTRLQKWDYRWKGAYFITICTHKRVHYFGEIRQGKMQLSKTGILADKLWHEIKNHAKHITLGEFIVMPNHIHGILIINQSPVKTRHALSPPPPEPSPPPPQPSQPSQTIGQQRFQNQGKNSVSSIIGGYKSAVTKHANRLGLTFKWQPSFYDIIIRDDKAFQNISNYIKNNPVNWTEDRFSKPTIK